MAMKVMPWEARAIEDERENNRWVCKECGENFPPTGKGHRAAGEHAMQDHDLKPSQAIEGLIDTRTGEVLWAGWGPRVLMACTARGYLTDTPPDEPKEEVAATPVATKAATRKPTKAELGALAIKEQRGYTVMKDIIITRGVEMMFSEAQELWPERFMTGKPDDFSRFIEEMATVGAIAIGMNFGLLIAAETAKRLTENEVYTDG